MGLWKVKLFISHYQISRTSVDHRKGFLCSWPNFCCAPLITAKIRSHSDKYCLITIFSRIKFIFWLIKVQVNLLSKDPWCPHLMMPLLFPHCISARLVNCSNITSSHILTATWSFVHLTNLLLWLSGLVCLSISLSSSLLPWIGFDNLLLPLKARSPLENSVTCLSGRISMEDLQTQRSTSMDWLSKFTEVYIHTAVPWWASIWRQRNEDQRVQIEAFLKIQTADLKVVSECIFVLLTCSLNVVMTSLKFHYLIVNNPCQLRLFLKNIFCHIYFTIWMNNFHHATV